MQKRTAEKVADILGMVELMLGQIGRPRKQPFKPRPEAVVGGKPSTVRGVNYLDVEKISLPGAFKLAAKEEGYSASVRKLAEDALIEASRWPFTGWNSGLSAVDDAEWDTRQLVRAARHARRQIEKEFSL